MKLSLFLQQTGALIVGTADCIRPCHKATILPRGTKKALFYHAKPHPHGLHCEVQRGKTKLFWSPGTIWPPSDKGEFSSLLFGPKRTLFYFSCVFDFKFAVILNQIQTVLYYVSSEDEN